MNNLHLSFCRRKQSGFNFIEVMIGLVVASVGLLGMVALQTKAVSATQDLVNKNNAIMLTEEIVNIMRSNPSAVFANSADQSIPMNNTLLQASMFFKNQGSNNFSLNPLDANGASCNTDAPPTTALEIRDCWLDKTFDLLPGAEDLFANEFHICRSTTDGGGCTANAGSIIEVRLAWTVPAGTCIANSTVCSVTSRIQL